MTDRSSTDLPHEIADQITKPFARFLKIEAVAGGLLFLAVLVALILANSAWSTPFLAVWETPIGLHFGTLDFTRSLRHWINDGLMTFFFFVISLELKRELVLGELRNLRAVALPFAAALGGMLVSVSLYLALTVGKPGMHGWGTVMATDTAFVIGCLALFGTRIPPVRRAHRDRQRLASPDRMPTAPRPYASEWVDSEPIVGNPHSLASIACN